MMRSRHRRPTTPAQEPLKGGRTLRRQGAVAEVSGKDSEVSGKAGETESRTRGRDTLRERSRSWSAPKETTTTACGTSSRLDAPARTLTAAAGAGRQLARRASRDRARIGDKKPRARRFRGGYTEVPGSLSIRAMPDSMLSFTARQRGEDSALVPIRAATKATRFATEAR